MSKWDDLNIIIDYLWGYVVHLPIKVGYEINDKLVNLTLFLITIDSVNNYFIVYYIDYERFVYIICKVNIFIKLQNNKLCYILIES